jgi:K+/H+ antiporter YhaU regulatory subunit KhtT
MIFNPGPDELLELSDSMIVIGEAEKIKGLMIMAGDSRSTGK